MELPQEIEAFYVLPAVRRELARQLVQRGLSQRLVAERLGVTGAAVSQYLANKRGTTMAYPAEVSSVFAASAAVIASSTDRAEIRAAMERVCTAIRDARVMCTLHRHHSAVPDGCSECYQ